MQIWAANKNWISATFLWVFVLIFPSIMVLAGFLDEQKEYERVKAAFAEKEATITSELQQLSIAANELHILIVAYKAEKELVLYARKKSSTVYSKLKTYTICNSSGSPGPKRKEGDGQVPEGFYHIERFNPMSNFHLSLGINYPNAADRIKGDHKLPGSDIFIHGGCVTVGCLPVTDDKIKEIYLYALLAKNNGQEHIPVYIFPFRMTDDNMKKYTAIHSHTPGIINFWKNLQQGYSAFSRSYKELNFRIDERGDYVF